MKKEKMKYEAQSKRLRDERAQQKKLYPDNPERWKNAKIGEIFPYSENYVSKFFSGKLLLDDEQYQKLADYWGVRVEYLKCEDDARTDADLSAFIKNYDSENFRRAQDFLESLGIQLAPWACVRVNMPVLAAFWDDDIKQYITNNTKVIDDLVNWYNRATKLHHWELFPVSLFFKEWIAPSLDKIITDNGDTDMVQSSKNYINNEDDKLLIALNFLASRGHYESTHQNTDKHSLNDIMDFLTASQQHDFETHFNLYGGGKLLASCPSEQFFQFIDEIRGLTSCAFDALVARSEPARQ